MTQLISFLAEKGALSPSIMAIALVVVVYFQAGVDQRQQTAISELQAQMRSVVTQQTLTAGSLEKTATILDRIDKHGTDAEVRHREMEFAEERARERAGKK